jgi:hypothetical protein
MRLVKGLIWLGFATALVVSVPQAARADGDQPAVEGGGEGSEMKPAPAEAPSVTKDPNRRRWGVGARLRYVFVPAGFLELFNLTHATSMNSIGVGGEVVTRKGDFDIVFGVEYDGASPSDGLYLKKGDNIQSPGPDFVKFDGLSAIGFDASFLWHAKLSDKVQLRYGGGLGINIVLGDVLQTDMNCDPGTQPSDLDDPATPKCHPLPGGKVNQKSNDVPPVVPIVNLILGARFKVAEGFSLNVEAGFHDMFFVGVSSDYVF